MTVLRVARGFVHPLVPIYTYLTAVGTYTGLAGTAPEAVEATTPWWLTLAWSATVAAGGVFSALGATGGRNRLEASGLSLSLAGVGLYLLAELTATLDFGDVMVVACLGGSFLLRQRELRKARQAVKQTQGVWIGGVGYAAD